MNEVAAVHGARRRHAARLGALLALALAAAACAGAGPTSRPQAAALDEIRALETHIEGEGVSSLGADCERGCRSVESICEASGRICSIAAELADLDALRSCRRAEDSCQEARRRLAERCPC